MAECIFVDKDINHLILRTWRKYAEISWVMVITQSPPPGMSRVIRARVKYSIVRCLCAFRISLVVMNSLMTSLMTTHLAPFMNLYGKHSSISWTPR